MGTEVLKGAVLAMIENPAVTEDVLSLKERLSKYMGEPDSMSVYLLQDKKLALGDVQATYASFFRSLYE
jgi:HlyD family secretion protein